MAPNAPAGPLLIGFLLNWCLFGILTVQTYLYYAAFPRDKPVVKIVVYLVYALETSQTVLVAKDAYDTFVVGFMNREAIKALHNIWFTCCIVTGVLAFIVQLLYAYRLQVLSRSCFVSGIVIVLTVAQLVGSIMAGVGGHLIGRVDQATKYEIIGHIISKITTAVCDLLIAFLMTCYLLRMRKHSLMEDIITRIVRLVVEAGSITAIVAVLDLTLFFTNFSDGYFWTFGLIVGKLYSNSMMVVFNSRFNIRRNIYDLSEATWRNSFIISTNVFDPATSCSISFDEQDDNISESGLRSRIHGIEDSDSVSPRAIREEGKEIAVS